jgi:putative ABC transport system ATP-binding protein
MEEVIKIKDVSKSYEMEEVKVQALKNINLTVKKNDFIAIMGPSGSGNQLCSTS